MKHDPGLHCAADRILARSDGAEPAARQRVRRSFAAAAPHRRASGPAGAWQWLTDPLTAGDGRALAVASGAALAAGTLWVALGAPLAG